MKNTPLLIVDAQNGFVNDRSRRALPAIRALAEQWIEAGEPIFMSQFTNFAGSQWATLIGWSRLQSEEEIAIHPDLASIVPHATTFRKRSYTCLVDPFESALRDASWSDVVICGIATDGCVLATAVDIFEFADRAVRPIVVSDACASHAGEDVHDEGLHLIQRFIGRAQVVSSDQL